MPCVHAVVGLGRPDEWLPSVSISHFDILPFVNFIVAATRHAQCTEQKRSGPSVRMQFCTTLAWSISKLMAYGWLVD